MFVFWECNLCFSSFYSQLQIRSPHDHSRNRNNSKIINLACSINLLLPLIRLVAARHLLIGYRTRNKPFQLNGKTVSVIYFNVIFSIVRDNIKQAALVARNPNLSLSILYTVIQSSKSYPVCIQLCSRAI